MVSYEFITEIKSILHNLHISGGNTVIAISNGVLRSRLSEQFTKNDRSVTLTTIWAREILKLLDWIKRRRMIAKREVNLALYEELTFTWKTKISNAIFENSIPKEMLRNFDQLPLGFTATNKATSTKNGVHDAYR